ncbi:MAG: dTDP-4-dehydrorhamnose 3,5-epimerase [Putridiphycobacter sp.]
MIKTFEIEDLLLIKPQVFGDDRGVFFESFNQKKFNEIIGEDVDFVQDNVSISSKNVLRGLHFQNPPHAQGKLVTVLKGAVLDVAVDIRKDSPTYGKSAIVELNGENKHAFWIPPGFAHGFLVLEDETIFSYKCTNFYHKASEGDLMWNDPKLNINWGISNPILSDKDKIAANFENFKSQF